jgi:hypothetical protein
MSVLDNRRRLWQLVSYGLLAIFVAGCGNGAERVVVRGNITYRGKTISRGAISFFPCDGTAGASVIVPVSEGRYAVESAGGLPVGKYQIVVHAFRPSNAKPPLPKPGLGGGKPPDEAEEQYLPAKFNERTTLKKTIDASPAPFILDLALND